MTLPGMVSHYFTTNSISLVLFDGFQALTQVISAFLRVFFCRLLCLSLYPYLKRYVRMVIPLLTLLQPRASK